MSYSLARATLDRVKFEDYVFFLGEQGEKLWLQVRYLEPDVDGDPNHAEIQHGREWLIDRACTPSDLVRTAFKAVMTSMEHRAREHFTYRGRRVFGPHFDVDDLVGLCERRDL